MRVLILSFGLMLLLFGCVGTPETGTPQETAEPAAPSEEPEGEAVDIPVGESGQAAAEAQETEPETAETPPEPEPEPEVQEENPLDEINHKELKFDTKDGWEIYGTVYYSETSPSTLIILIPMLGAERGSYDSLIPQLHEEAPYADIIAMDMRGHGESTNIAEYTGFQTGDFRAMERDLDAVVAYFSVGRPSIDNYYIVGASIGSSVGLDYAVKHGEVSKLVMISPGIEYQGYDITEDAESYLHELYIMAAEEDSYSAATASTIYNICPSDTKEKKVYDETDAHGTDLFSATEDYSEPAVDVIVKWIK